MSDKRAEVPERRWAAKREAASGGRTAGRPILRRSSPPPRARLRYENHSAVARRTANEAESPADGLDDGMAATTWLRTERFGTLASPRRRRVHLIPTRRSKKSINAS